MADKLEWLAAEFENCLNTDPVLDRVPSRLGHYQRTLILVKSFFETDIVELRWHKPEIANWLQEQYAQLFSDIKAVDQLIAKSQTMRRPTMAIGRLSHDMGIFVIGLRDIAKMAREEDPEDGGLLKSLKNPVPCTDVSGIIRVRSDNIARRLKAGRYPVVKLGKKNYCDADDAAVLWPKWKKHWQEKKKSEEI